MARAACGVVLLAFLLNSLSLPAAAGDKPSSVQDLQYGEVLFHYYQQDWFNSIVRLQIAQQQQRLPHHAGEAELLLGGLNLSYGLSGAAEDIFHRLLTGEAADEHVRNRAWYHLARLSYQRGDTDRALQALAQIDGRISTRNRAEAAYLHSLLLLQEGRNEEAIQVIEDSRSHKAWSPYLKYNLGVARIRSQRLSEGAESLNEIGRLNASSEELRLLRDKANLALGFSYLQAGDAVEARVALERVRLGGPLSGKALLGAGWADAEHGDYGRALVPWSELETRNASDPAVQEALLAIPYAMAKMNLHGRAVQQYDRGIRVLLEEQQQLDNSIRAIRNGELLAALQKSRRANDWKEALDILTGIPALQYQAELLAAHDFQEAVKAYVELAGLQANLNRWAVDIETYDDMLATRQARYANHHPDAERALKGPAMQALQERHTRLTDSVDQLAAGSDAVGLANAEEARQWRQLQEIGERLARLPDTAEINALRDKRQTLQGLLYWQLNQDYKPRLWRARRQLDDVDRLIGGTGEALDTLREADLDSPAAFGDFGKRIAMHKQTIDKLLGHMATTQLAQGKRIEALAVAELEWQKERLDTHIIQARYALAQIHDRALEVQAEQGVVQ